MHNSFLIKQMLHENYDLHGPRWNSKVTYVLRLLVFYFFIFAFSFFFLSFCCSVKCMSYQNLNQNCSINKVQNLREKEGKYPRFRLQQFFLRWLKRVMQDHEAHTSDLNRKLIFLFFLLFSWSKLLKHNKQGPKFVIQQSPLISRL